MTMLKQRTQNSQFLKIKNGKFYLSKDAELANPYDEIEGNITNLYFKDEEYEGIKNRKLYTTISDGDDSYTFGVIADSLQCSMFLNFLSNCNLTQKLTISPFQKTETIEGKERTSRVLFVKQNGQSIKSKYQKEELPEIKTIIVNKKPVYDKSDLLDFYENIVETKLKPQFINTDVIVNGSSYEKETLPKKEVLPWDNPEAVAESESFDLPF